jgi:hypothetical protein
MVGGGVSFVAFVAAVLVGSASQGTIVADIAAYALLASLAAALVFTAIGTWHHDERRAVATTLRRINRELERPLDVREADGPFVIRGARARARIRRELRLLRLALPLMLLVAIIALEWWLRFDT